MNKKGGASCITTHLPGFVQLLGDPPGARTQDPNIKSVVLYLLS